MHLDKKSMDVILTEICYLTRVLVRLGVGLKRKMKIHVRPPLKYILLIFVATQINYEFLFSYRFSFKCHILVHCTLKYIN